MQRQPGQHICMLAANAATSAASSRTPTRATKNQGLFAGIPPLRPQFIMPRYVPARRDYNYRIISRNLARIRRQPAGKYSTGRSKYHFNSELASTFPVQYIYTLFSTYHPDVTSSLVLIACSCVPLHNYGLHHSRYRCLQHYRHQIRCRQH
jgi:hypothetical protein